MKKEEDVGIPIALNQGRCTYTGCTGCTGSTGRMPLPLYGIYKRFYMVIWF